MKVSLVLTFCVLTVGLLVAVGCARSRLATSHPPAQAPAPDLKSAEPTPAPAPKAPEQIVPSVFTVKPQIVSEPPPRPQIEVVGAAPGPDLTWIPGHWDWDGHWVWKAGEWASLPSPSASWVPGRWVKRDQGWVWISGYWRLLASR